MNVEFVIEKLKENGGKISYFDATKFFGEEAGLLLKQLLDAKKIAIIQENGGIYIALKEFEKIVPSLSKKTSFKAPLVYENFKIPDDIIEEKNLGAIAHFLAETFVNLYHVKTLKKKRNIIGTFLWDGKRYIEAEEIAKKFLEDMFLFNMEKLQKKKIKVVSVLKDYLFHIKYMNLFEFEEAKLISFKNCVFDWSSLLEKNFEKAFRKHDPLLLVFNYIDYDLEYEKIKEALENLEKYEELSTEKLEEIAKNVCPKSLKVLKDWVGERWIQLFEIIGYTLYPRYPFNKAVMLIGEGSNGKSTFLRLVKDILGRDNTVSISLKDICENRFSASYLYKKLANIYPDLPKLAIRDTGMFKILTGEDEISADRKFKERITFTNYAKMLFSANELPKVNDMTYAFWRRWLVIEFPNQFERREGFYEKTFTEEEKKGVIVMAVLAFRNVLIRRKFSFEGTEADYKEVWLRNADNVYAFLKDMEEAGKIRKSKGSKELTADVYSLYQQWCEDNDEDPVTKTAFSQRMQLHGFSIIRSGGKKYYKNIKIIRSDKEGVEAFI